MKYIIVWVSLFLLLPSAWAADIDGVSVPDQVVLQGEKLALNGAGMRTKFFFDIYVGALYLEKPVSHAAAVLAKPSPARVSMVIVYSEVDKGKLIKGWTSGFKKNQSKASFGALEERLAVFNQMFVDLEKGDRINFDFLTSGQTRVVIKGKQVGSIEGVDFQQALLAVWLGDKPADNDLKQAMLKGK